jgi:hypothetical protein
MPLLGAFEFADVADFTYANDASGALCRKVSKHLTNYVETFRTLFEG